MNITLRPLHKNLLSLAILAAFIAPQVTLAADSVANQSALVEKSSKLSDGIDSDQLNKCLYNQDQLC